MDLAVLTSGDCSFLTRESNSAGDCANWASDRCANLFVWEVFVGPDNRIREFAYHRGGDPKPISVFSLEDYRKAGPLLVSLNHSGALNGKPERIFFSDVAVKLVGSDTWMKAQ